MSGLSQGPLGTGVLVIVSVGGISVGVKVCVGVEDGLEVGAVVGEKGFPVQDTAIISMIDKTVFLVCMPGSFGILFPE
jgi:hypothetical protein